MYNLYKKINYIPNWISFSRILAIWPFLYFLSSRSSFIPINPFYSKLIALGIFIFIIISDYLDGLIARWLKQENLFGQVLDYIADKLVIIITYLALYILHPGTIPFWLLFVIIIREVFITFLRFGNLQKKKVQFIGQLKTFIHFFTGFIILLVLSLQEFLVVYMKHKLVSYQLFLKCYLSNYYHFHTSFEILILINGFLTIISGIIYIYQYRKIVH